MRRFKLRTDSHFPMSIKSVTYSDAEIRILVEEFINQQKKEFTFKNLCSFVLYWAMEEGKTADNDSVFRGSNELPKSDQDRVRRILDSIVKDGRIATVPGDNTRFEIKAY